MADVLTRAQMMVEHGADNVQQPWFATQEPAMQRSRDFKGMFVFSRDKRKGWVPGTEPVKQYTSRSLRAIYRYMYTRKEAWHRCVYEILRATYPDGTPVASKLNVDVDISSDDCDDFMERGWRFHEHFLPDLRAFLAKTLDEDFADESKTPMVVMDSTTPKKFSLHYVLGGAMFENNYHAGAMMRTFRAHVIEKYGPPETPGHPYFFLKKDAKYLVDGSAYSFAVDLSIYTINRAFRMLGNCKFSKKVMLIPLGTPREQQYTRVFSFEEFRASVVQDPVLAETCKIFAVTELDGSLPRSHSVSRTKIEREGQDTAAKRGRVLSADEMRRPRAQGIDREAIVRVPHDVAENLCRALHTLLPKVSLLPGRIKYKAHLGEFVVPQAQASAYCYVAGREHSSSASYVVVSCLRGTYEARCHKMGCYDKSRQSNANVREWSMPEALRATVDGFLASASSSGQRPIAVGGVFALVLEAERTMPAGYAHEPNAEDDPAYVAGMDLDLELEPMQD